LESLDKNLYEVDLQLYKNEGPLLSFIPDSINLLPETVKHRGKIGRVIKVIKFIFSKYFFKAVSINIKQHQFGFSKQVLCDFQVAALSRENKKEYDYAAGFMEGWADRYVAFKINAKTKYGWIHSKFSAIAPIPELEYPWMKKMNRIHFVTQSGLEDFCKNEPQISKKVYMCDNILDSDIIRSRSAIIDEGDEYFLEYVNSKAFKIITVCRLDIVAKGLDRAVLCAAKLKKEGINFIWYVIGDGDDHDKLLEIIHDNDVVDRFKLVGKRINPYPFIKESDIFCMPSRWEGKPISVTESMMLGIPPVVTEYTAAHEQIENGVEGLIAANNDKAIYEKVKYCIDNSSVVKQMKSRLLCKDCGNANYIKSIENELFKG
jgi:glycosyltransferase involved in cell wall biosynthesis